MHKIISNLILESPGYKNQFFRYRAGSYKVVRLYCIAIMQTDDKAQIILKAIKIVLDQSYIITLN